MTLRLPAVIGSSVGVSKSPLGVMPDGCSGGQLLEQLPQQLLCPAVSLEYT
jgi:hypothetical protein